MDSPVTAPALAGQVLGSGNFPDIHAMPERTPAALREVFRRHDSELLE